MNYNHIVVELLDIELNNFASKLNLINTEPITLGMRDTIKALSSLYELTKKDTVFSRQIAILITALLTCHGHDRFKEGVRQVATPILSKMGFSPSIRLIDSNFNETGVYSPIPSYLDKLTTIANDLQNSIIIQKDEHILTKFQSDLWNLIDKSNIIGVSAPTSAGKSFLIYLKIIDLILQGKLRFVYIVPTLSLISQVTSDLSKLLRQYGIHNISILNSFENIEGGFIYVVTQERALSIFSEEGIDRIDMLVVEEVQNIERVANEGSDRSRILFDILKDIKHDCEVGKIILSGPRLKNIGDMGFAIFQDISEEATSESPPVLNLTYSVSKEKGNYYFNQYCPFFRQPRRLQINNSSKIYGLGGSQYNAKFNNYLHSILDKVDDSINIVFSPTPSQARKSANAYFSHPHQKQAGSDQLNVLSTYIANSVHPNYDLVDMLRYGIAYHTGKTPSHVRKCLEIASTTGLIKYLFCTTTLMQGVNLPANNIIIRNPKLFTKRYDGAVNLSAYEFANLRGRAGRLLIDFVGRSIVLDEGSFIDNTNGQDQDQLFEEQYKEIHVGYKDQYYHDKDYIDTALNEQSIVSDDEHPKHIITYIRYTLLKYGRQGLERLRDVGIDIHTDLLETVIKDLSKLDIPIDICLKNRYWDPLDLNYLFFAYQKSPYTLPKSVWDNKLAEKIYNLLIFMRDNSPYYFKRYIEVNNYKYLQSVAILAERWSREVTLQKILIDHLGTNKSDDLHEKIDEDIVKLNSKVSFGLPMLLKPLSDFENDDKSFISAVEYGAHKPHAKYLIDRGIPREVAIKLGKIIDPASLDNGIKEINIPYYVDTLDIWEQKQIEYLMI